MIRRLLTNNIKRGMYDHSYSRRFHPKQSSRKMSNKSNKITIRSFPGSKVEDMHDYVKPSLKQKPDNIIVHTGTNNLKTDDPTTVAEGIVSICEQIESESNYRNRK